MCSQSYHIIDPSACASPYHSEVHPHIIEKRSFHAATSQYAAHKAMRRSCRRVSESTSRREICEVADRFRFGFRRGASKGLVGLSLNGKDSSYQADELFCAGRGFSKVNSFKCQASADVNVKIKYFR